MRREQKSAFTMVELLVAMAIIGMLIAVAIWGIGLAQQGARNTQRREVASQITAKLADYYARFGANPTCVYTGATQVLFTNGACTSETAPAAPAQSLTLTLPGISAPAAGIKVDNRTTYSVVSDAGHTSYIINPNFPGYQVCASLEGTGSANMSDPGTITCP